MSGWSASNCSDWNWEFSRWRVRIGATLFFEPDSRRMKEIAVEIVTGAGFVRGAASVVVENHAGKKFGDRRDAPRAADGRVVSRVRGGRFFTRLATPLLVELVAGAPALIALYGMLAEDQRRRGRSARAAVRPSDRHVRQSDFLRRLFARVVVRHRAVFHGELEPRLCAILFRRHRNLHRDRADSDEDARRPVALGCDVAGCSEFGSRFPIEKFESFRRSRCCLPEPRSRSR